MVNAPAKSINDKDNMKNGPMRPGVDNDQEQKIEESLENLDHLLNNIKNKDPSKKE